MRTHVRDLRLQDVAASVEFINELDPRVELDPLLEQAVERFLELYKVSDADDLDGLGVDANTLELIQERLSLRTHGHSMTELFVDLAGSDGWNPRDIKHMVTFTMDDYYQWIASEDSVDTIGLLRKFLSRFGRETGDEQVVTGRIKDALRKIGNRSRIDRFRVERLIKLNLEAEINEDPTSQRAVADL